MIEILGKKRELKMLESIIKKNEYKGLMITGAKGSGKSLLLRYLEQIIKNKCIKFPKSKKGSATGIKEFFKSIKSSVDTTILIDDFDDQYLKIFMNELADLKYDFNVHVIATRLDIYKNEKNDAEIFKESGFDQEVNISTIDIDAIETIVFNFFKDKQIKFYKVDLYNVIDRFLNSNYKEIAEALDTAYCFKGSDLKITDIYPGKPYKAARYTLPYNEQAYQGDVSYQVCVSEAAKIFMAYYYPENTQFTRCYFKDYSHAETFIYHYVDCVDDNRVDIANFSYPYLQETKIKIAMAGYLNEINYFEKFDGSIAIKYKRIINDNLDEIIRTCYMEPIYNIESKQIDINEISYKNLDNQKIIDIKNEIFMRLKYEVLDLLDCYSDEINKLSNYLYKNKYIEYDEIEDIIKLTIRRKDKVKNIIYFE